MTKKSFFAIVSGLILLVIIIIVFTKKYNGPLLVTQSEGYGLGLISDQKVSSHNLFFKVDNGILQGSIIVNNRYNDEQLFFLTTFLDYEQKKINLDQKEELIHKITVKPNGSVSFNFSLPIAEGNHDLIVMLIRDPEDKSQGLFLPEERVAFRRAFIQTGKEINHVEPIPETSHQEGVDNAFFVSFLDENNNRLSSRRIGETLFLNIAPPQKVKNYFLFTVLNGKQIPFNVGGSEYGTTLYQPNSEEPIKLAFSIQDNLSPGQLFAILVPNPYTIWENDQGVLNKDAYWTIFPASKLQLYN